MTQPPPQQPPTQVFVQQRRSGCGTLLVALLALAIITAIVILLGACWAGFSANDGSADTPAHRALRWWRTGMTGNIWIDLPLSLAEIEARDTWPPLPVMSAGTTYS
jgi:hypothetical protein